VKKPRSLGHSVSARQLHRAGRVTTLSAAPKIVLSRKEKHHGAHDLRHASDTPRHFRSRDKNGDDRGTGPAAGGNAAKRLIAGARGTG
jgi:hypothetical protein